MRNLTLPFILAAGLMSGCATVSMTELNAETAEISLKAHTPLQKEVSEFVSMVESRGLSDPQSGLEFMTQLLLRGSGSMVASDDRYRNHVSEGLQTRLTDDAAVIAAALDTLSQNGIEKLLTGTRIVRGDVTAFEAAVIMADDIGRTFTRCVEADPALKTPEIDLSISNLSDVTERARDVANDLAAAFNGNLGEVGT